MAAGAYRFRRVDPKTDRKTLERLHKATLPHDEFPPWDESVWWVGVSDKGRPVAFCGVCIQGKLAYLIRAGVMRPHRGRRLQRRMVRLRERYVRTQGCTWVYTTTFCNPRSANTLIGCSYRQYWPADPWGETGTDYWYRKFE